MYFRYVTREARITLRSAGEREKSGCAPLAWDYGQSSPIEIQKRYSYNSFMKSASVSKTKNELSSLLDQVKQGETILILDRNRPVAKIIPAGATDQDGRIARLERAGLIRRGKGHRVDRIV